MRFNHTEGELQDFEASSEKEIIGILDILIHSGIDATLTVGASRCGFEFNTEDGYKLFLLEDDVYREQTKGIVITDSSGNRLGSFGISMPDNIWIRVYKRNNGSVELSDIGLEWKTNSDYCHLHYMPADLLDISDVVSLEED